MTRHGFTTARDHPEQFGDITPDDVFGIEGADPDAVANWIREHIGKRAKASDPAIVALIIRHLRREGSAL